MENTAELKHSVISGFFAALAGFFGKITFDSNVLDTISSSFHHFNVGVRFLWSKFPQKKTEKITQHAFQNLVTNTKIAWTNPLVMITYLLSFATNKFVHTSLLFSFFHFVTKPVDLRTYITCLWIYILLIEFSVNYWKMNRWQMTVYRIW